MKLYQEQSGFSFLYGGNPLEYLEIKQTVRQEENRVFTTIDFGDGLTVTNIRTEYPDYDAVEWVNHFENSGKMPSQIISELWDCETFMPFPYDAPPKYTAYIPEPENNLCLTIPKGSTWIPDEFGMDRNHYENKRYSVLFLPGDKKTVSTSGGRSSESHAPFFRMHRKDRGYVAAIGWTGQWTAQLERTEEGVIMRSGIENTSFRVLPGEKFRTSSVVIMPYIGTEDDGINRWRRFVKQHFSLIGQPGRPEIPFCAGIWGGMSTASVLKRIEIIKNEKLPFDTLWMDAGWYGVSEKESPDEFEGDWRQYTGDWRVNPTHHPDGLQDVKKAARQAGLRFLLWIEPERVVSGVPITLEHPEYFLGEPKPGANLLLFLGNPEAWKYCHDILFEKIKNLDITIYRQDFNFPPLWIWRDNDTPDRQGMTEILHINGLYRLWDTLLKEFPHLLIDNCASGGRRIDIETLRRSIPLWRSDAQCPANPPISSAQQHAVQYGQWMPYSGTGTGRPYDTYRFRSSYAPALSTNYTFSERDSFGEDPEKICWLRNMAKEYLRVRPYLSCDLYALTQTGDASDIWSAVRYDRPEQEDGVILIYRREDSPYVQSCFPFTHVKKEVDYCFEDADTGETFTVSGKDLLENGLSITVDIRKTAKVMFYHRVENNGSL